MKDHITPKLVFAVLVLIAVGMAVWTGMDTKVEASDATAAPHAAYTTPF